MLAAISQAIVLIFGGLVCALSAWGIYAPANLIELVRNVMDRNWGIRAAVVARILLGAALILAAGGSRFPVVFEALGWVAIFAAVGLAFMGRERFRRFIGWFDRFSPALIRLWLLLGLAFGGLLVYGVA
jgi:hypothetical protein